MSFPTPGSMSDVQPLPGTVGYHAPSLLAFEEPQYIPLQYGVIQDLDFSPDGTELVTTR
jgi:hypothetical protein